MLTYRSTSICQGVMQDASWWPSNPLLLQMTLLYLGLLSAICTFYLRLTENENIGGSSVVDTVLEEALLTRATSDLIENTSPILSSIKTGTLQEPASLQTEDPLPPTTIQPPAPATAAPVHINTTKDEQTHDDIPSFSEWAKKQMAEAEKNKGENLTVNTVKVRRKNYASPDCGAKVVKWNEEAGNPGAILSPSRDDYMLNACFNKIWFVVELCEAIQPRMIQIANFELFSSSPKDISISVSDRLPPREWTFVSSITAKDERTEQTFTLPDSSQFVKYFKVEINSHYGTEHYCPISLFKAFGISELEVLDNVDNDEDDREPNAHPSYNGPYDEDEDLGQVDQFLTRDEPTNNVNNEQSRNDDDDNNDSTKSVTTTTTKTNDKNILDTATAAVLSIVKKAAQVLVVKGDENNGTCGEDNNDTQDINKQLQYCITPAYLIVCTNCTDEFYNRVYGYISCNGADLESMLTNTFIHRMLLNGRICPDIGLNWGIIPSLPLPPSTKPKISIKDPLLSAFNYIKFFLTAETTAALCNYLAIDERKVLLNSSQTIQYTESLTSELTTMSACDKEEEVSSVTATPGGDVSESLITISTSEESLISSISPTKTLPFVIEEMSSESNESTGTIVNQHSKIDSIQNITSTKTSEELTLGTSTLAITLPTSSPSSTMATEHSSTSIISDNKTTDVNITNENQESEVPLAPSIPVVVQDEVDDQLASLYPELEEEIGGGSITESVTVKTTTASTTTQKESVFVRLANRIKALEVNMSLSGQYLEELSRRYKKQVEELQRTLVNLVEERRLSSERENAQITEMTILTRKVNELTLALAELISEREKVSFIIGQHGVIILVEVAVFLIVVAVCRWLGAAKNSNNPNSTDRCTASSQQQQLRRHSMDNIDGPSAPKIRRPSEEACIPAGTTHKELLVDGIKRKTSREGARRRKRRRKEHQNDDTGNGLIIIDSNNDDNSKLTTKWLVPQLPTTDYTIRTALWTRAKRTSAHTQTSSSQETLYAGQYINNNNSSTTTVSTTSSSTNIKQKKKNSSGGAFKKIVKKLF